MRPRHNRVWGGRNRNAGLKSNRPGYQSRRLPAQTTDGASVDRTAPFESIHRTVRFAGLPQGFGPKGAKKSPAATGIPVAAGDRAFAWHHAGREGAASYSSQIELGHLITGRQVALCSLIPFSFIASRQENDGDRSRTRPVGGASGIARSDTWDATMRVPRFSPQLPSSPRADRSF